MAAAFVLSLAIPWAAALGAQDWPQILGPTRNGVYAGPAIATAFPRGGPPLVWKRDVGEGFAGPSVDGGRLILFHRVGGRETVEALDAVTGKTIWASIPRPAPCSINFAGARARRPR